MFARLAEQYRSVVRDLELSLQALACCLRDRGQVASCYTCGEGQSRSGVSFVADLGEGHVVRFLVSDYGITWVESRNGMELLKLEGADAIQELNRVAQQLQQAVIGATPTPEQLPAAAAAVVKAPR
ncbi:MAG: DUF1815 family protein [Cyanobacteria bacterium K_Offshore_surface_m2_239]|nr:DUF1815 family protein [Cyanobacteria bacterium K_Offshore_surface_m2_239]